MKAFALIISVVHLVEFILGIICAAFADDDIDARALVNKLIATSVVVALSGRVLEYW